MVALLDLENSRMDVKTMVFESMCIISHSTLEIISYFKTIKYGVFEASFLGTRWSTIY